MVSEFGAVTKQINTVPSDEPNFSTSVRALEKQSTAFMMDSFFARFSSNKTSMEYNQ
jgi:hypothetical protein